VVLALLVVALPWLPVNPFVIHLAETFCYTAIAVIGLNVLLGLSGQMSLGQAGFYALGAYGSALAALRWGWPVPVAIGFGTLVAATVGAAVGIFALRTRGLYLAMATMAVGFVIEILAQRWIGVTGGAMGLASVPQLEFGGHAGFLCFAGACLLAVQVASDYVNDSRTGRKLRAVRESEAFASAVGVVVPVWRAATFAVCAALAGLGGALFAHQSGFVGSDAFNIRLSVSLLIAAVIGGLGARMGPLLGTAVLLSLAEFSSSIEKYGLMLHGGVLLLVLLVFPEGVAGMLRRLASSPGNSAGSVTPRDTAEAVLPPMPPGCSLAVRGVSKSYAGVRAVSDVTIDVVPGSIHGLIGPNGAGKSTLINVISGQFACDSGSIQLGTEGVTNLDTPARAKRGLARTFQNLQLIEALPAIENVQLGLPPDQSVWSDFRRWWSAQGFEAVERAQALGIMKFLRIDHLAGKFPSELSYGHRKLVELSRAVAQRPRLMLLDEPIAGLNAQEAREVAAAVKRLNAAGVTIVVVEHNMEFVMSICDRVSVLDHGELIMTGTPAEVQKDARVVSAYLGGQGDD
jgi:branched-chain amino acid transport system ATP-binding protein/branched-chain amino acid transport system permease protein